MVTNGSVMNSFAQVAPLIINITGIMVLIQAKGTATTAGDVFAMMWVFGVFMSRPIRNSPWTVVMYLDGVTSCKRLEAFFAAPLEPLERSKLIESARITQDKVKNSMHEIPDTTEQRFVIGPSIHVAGLSLRLDDRVVFDDVSFSIPAGQFIAITGDVGSGKTQLLLALLLDGAASFKSYKIGPSDVTQFDIHQVRSHFLYVPQDGFVMSATLRENVGFDYDAPQSQDAAVLGCLLRSDFDPGHEGLVFGLNSEIGERGVNLSGGQKQRVGLARADYQGLSGQRGIVLLDDSLSAVDTDTEAKLISQLICGSWKHKTRILVTHRLSVLSLADQVWHLEDGKLNVIRPHGEVCL
jgi:ABC-type multidrug transport system fused ATPase/permease subunit